MDSKQQESLFYHYILRNPVHFKNVQKEFFKNPFTGALYTITKQYYNTFNELPFIGLNDLSPEVITEYADELGAFKGDNGMTKIDFIDSTNMILDYPFKNYDAKWVKRTFEAWMKWTNMTKAIKKAVAYQKDMVVTPENAQDIINKVKTMILSGTVVSDDDDPKDFFDPEAHKQPERSEIVPCGHPTLNKFLNGGFEKGTTTIFYGGTNVGKCVSPDTTITVRNKKTGETMALPIEQFYEMVSSKPSL